MELEVGFGRRKSRLAHQTVGTRLNLITCAR